MEVTGQQSNQSVNTRLNRLHEWITHPDQVVGLCQTDDQPKPRGVHRRRLRRLSAEHLQELTGAYSDGVTINDLAAKFQIDPSTVQKHVRGQGLPRRYPRLEPARLDEAVRLYMAGDSLAKVGKHFGISKDTVARVLRKAGTPLRPQPGR